MEGSVRCCPRWAVVMKARGGFPAKTMSRGSSPTSSVRTTCGVPVRLTMLTLSESRFVTHTSVLLRAATATGSRPTGTRYSNTGDPEVRSKDFQRAVGRVDGEQRVPIRRHGQRTHLAAFKLDERRSGGSCRDDPPAEKSATPRREDAECQKNEEPSLGRLVENSVHGKAVWIV